MGVVFPQIKACVRSFVAPAADRNPQRYQVKTFPSTEATPAVILMSNVSDSGHAGVSGVVGDKSLKASHVLHHMARPPSSHTICHCFHSARHGYHGSKREVSPVDLLVEADAGVTLSVSL